MGHDIDNAEGRKRARCAFQTIRAGGADAGDAQPVGAHIVDVSSAFRPSCDGPAQWTMSPFANRVLTAIRVKEELSAPAIIFVTRSNVPPSPAASFFIDLIKRAAGHIGSKKDHGP